MTEADEVTGRAKGGVARAEVLSPDERSGIARKAAQARWAKELPHAINEGDLTIGDLKLPVAVLSDETRLMISKAFLTALGRPWKGSYKRTNLPNFIEAKNLKPFVSKDLMDVLEPIEFVNKGGQKVLGYRAELLPLVCDVYLAARAQGDVLTPSQERIAKRAEILVRSFAKIGIVALVDEATGYQRDRAQNALAQILEQYIAKELQPYIPTFPSDFYQEIFRLRGLDYPKDRVQRPRYFGTLTNDIVYRRLAPGVLDELRAVTPRLASGRLSKKLFQRLTQNRGYPKLREHLGAVVTMMQLSSDWHDFTAKLDKLRPRLDVKSIGRGRQLSFDYDSASDSGRGL